MAINAMLDKVPNPGFSFSGIHSSNTSVLIPNVDQPIVMSKRFDIPCAKTDHGAFPISLWINKESPSPNMNNPKKRTNVRSGVKSHLDEAVHDV
jgi:hypothetical protein